MSDSPSPLDELTEIVDRRGRRWAARKVALLSCLEGIVLPSAGAVEGLHETLLVLRAYPDSAALLKRVDALLAGFADREDLKRFSDELADSGIAGTVLYYRFYWTMAEWLARRWPALLHINWEDVDNQHAIERVLEMLVLYSETPALDTMVLKPRTWFNRLKGPDETDAAFLIHRFAVLPTNDFGREMMYEALDMPLRLDPGADTPSRTRALYRWRPVVFQKRVRRKRRPSLRSEAAKPPITVKSLSREEGFRLIDLARETMVTRHRDLQGINWADADDAQLVDAGDGLSFACIGLRPERRLMLESVYVLLILKNGVPVGYFQAATLFGASELNYNLFAPWRGAEAAVIYARGVAVVHHLLGSDVFAASPYQLGDGNKEAIRTGAFWFYYKLGYRPEDAKRKAIIREERAAMKRDGAHRSSPTTLRRLCREYIYFYLAKRRDDVIGKLNYGHIGLAVSRYVAQRFGADREAAVATCVAEAADRLGVATMAGFTEGERIAWERWCPLVMLLDEIEDWSARDKRALVGVIRAKGSRSERDYVRRFDRHQKLRQALANIARKTKK